MDCAVLVIVGALDKLNATPWIVVKQRNTFIDMLVLL